MKNFLLLLFGIAIAVPAVCQTYRIGEITQSWIPKHVHVADGLVYKYKLYDKYDTALRFDIGPDPDTFDVTITFKKRIPAPPLPDIVSTIDDNNFTLSQAYNPAINAGDNIYITTGWSHFKGQTWNTPHYNTTYSFADIAGAYVELNCTCYKIEWWSEKRENHGIAGIQKMKEQSANGVITWVPDGALVDVDLYDKRTDNNSLLVWTSPAGLPNATYKYRVLYTGRKNNAATQTNIGHDKFVTYTKQQ